MSYSIVPPHTYTYNLDFTIGPIDPCEICIISVAAVLT